MDPKLRFKQTKISRLCFWLTLELSNLTKRHEQRHGLADVIKSIYAIDYILKKKTTYSDMNQSKYEPDCENSGQSDLTPSYVTGSTGQHEMSTKPA